MTLVCSEVRRVLAELIGFAETIVVTVVVSDKLDCVFQVCSGAPYATARSARAARYEVRQRAAIGTREGEISIDFGRAVASHCAIR